MMNNFRAIVCSVKDNLQRKIYILNAKIISIHDKKGINLVNDVNIGARSYERSERFCVASCRGQVSGRILLLKQVTR